MKTEKNRRVRVASSLALALAPVVCGLSVGGCGVDFDPRTTLSGYRVLGIQASPPETTPDGSVQLQAYDYWDGDEPLSYRWSICPYSEGALVSYECIDAALETSVGQTPVVSVDLGPDGLELRQKLSELGTLPNADGTPRTFERGFDIWIRLQSGPDCSECESIETLKRLFIRQSDTQSPNANPVIESFEIVGNPERGRRVTLRVGVDEPQRYRDPAAGDEKTEEYLYTWYTTQGQTDPQTSYGETRESTLTLPSVAGSMEVMVAVRDGRGGLAVARQTIDVQ